MAQEWYIDYGNRVDGPLSSRELQERAASGRLRPADRVSPDRRRWAEAAKVKGLRFVRTNGNVSVVASPGADVTATTVYQPGELAPAPLPPGTLRQSPAPETQVAVPDAPPDIPGYEITGALGSGAFGVVYKARQEKLDRVVALKTVRFADRNDDHVAARFQKEAVSLARLQHPNIVSVFDTGRHGGLVYFAMELLKGEDLGHRIFLSGRIDERTAWAVARQTAAALAHAAAEGIYHRDVKPANLFLVPMPTGFGMPSDLPMVKVTDFGLALTRRGGDSIADDRLTAAGVVLGTPTYMAPEQFKTSDIDHRADLYALGATVYHALAGEPPFGQKTVWDIMLQKAKGTPPRLEPPVSAESAELVAAMMAPELADRIADYAELIARIDALPVMQGVLGAATVASLPSLPSLPNLPLLGSPMTPPGLTRTEFFPSPAAPKVARRKRRLRLAAVAAAFGVAAATGAVALTGGGPPVAGAYVVAGSLDSLFDQTTLGWIADGGQLTTEEIEGEGNHALIFDGTVRHNFTRPENFQVAFGVDLASAKAIEMTVCPPTNPDAARLVVRMSRADGVVFGSRVGERGAFTPIGKPTPLADDADTGDRAGFPEVVIARKGKVWEAAYRKTVLGAARDDGLVKSSSVKLRAEGGKGRIDSAVVEELAPKS